MENRIVELLSKVVISTLIIMAFFTASYAEDFHGYVKNDIQKMNLYQGEKLDCEMSKDKSKCCFKEESGEICLSIKDLSLTKVSMVDLFLKDVKYADDADAKVDACNEGQLIKNETDGYIWSYGFKVGSTKKNNSNVIVEGSYIVQVNNNPIYSLSITKQWEGKSDGLCHKINFNKSDIDQFIKQYQKIGKYLNVEKDLNIPVIFYLRLFSPRPEVDYKNNVIIKKSILPVDSSDVWPPRH